MLVLSKSAFSRHVATLAISPRSPHLLVLVLSPEGNDLFGLLAAKCSTTLMFTFDSVACVLSELLLKTTTVGAAAGKKADESG